MNSKNKTFALGAGDILHVTLKKDSPESLIAQTKNVLKEITKHVNN
jgi:hypothetical protein